MGFRHVPERRQEFVAHYVLPDPLGRRLRAVRPGTDSIGLALRGLRQWLRVHALAPGDLALPSRAVDLLWLEFRGMKEEYEDYRRHAYGRLHRDLVPTDGRRARRDLQAEALTFAMACADEGLRPSYPHNLPVLYSVDSELNVPLGHVWVLNCGREACAAPPEHRCARHELVPHVPSKLPKQVRFDLPQLRPTHFWGGNAMDSGLGG